MADPFAQFADAPQDGFAQFQDAPTQNQLDSTRQSTISTPRDPNADTLGGFAADVGKSAVGVAGGIGKGLIDTGAAISSGLGLIDNPVSKFLDEQSQKVDIGAEQFGISSGAIKTGQAASFALPVGGIIGGTFALLGKTSVLTNRAGKISRAVRDTLTAAAKDPAKAVAVEAAIASGSAASGEATRQTTGSGVLGLGVEFLTGSALGSRAAKLAYGLSTAKEDAVSSVLAERLRKDPELFARATQNAAEMSKEGLKIRFDAITKDPSVVATMRDLEKKGAQQTRDRLLSIANSQNEFLDATAELLQNKSLTPNDATNIIDGIKAKIQTQLDDTITSLDAIGDAPTREIVGNEMFQTLGKIKDAGEKEATRLYSLQAGNITLPEDARAIIQNAIKKASSTAAKDKSFVLSQIQPALKAVKMEVHIKTSPEISAKAINELRGTILGMARTLVKSPDGKKAAARLFALNEGLTKSLDLVPSENLRAANNLWKTIRSTFDRSDISFFFKENSDGLINAPETFVQKFLTGSRSTKATQDLIDFANTDIAKQQGFDMNKIRQFARQGFLADIRASVSNTSALTPLKAGGYVAKHRELLTKFGLIDEFRNFGKVAKQAKELNLSLNQIDRLTLNKFSISESQQTLKNSLSSGAYKEQLKTLPVEVHGAFKRTLLNAAIRDRDGRLLSPDRIIQAISAHRDLTANIPHVKRIGAIVNFMATPQPGKTFDEFVKFFDNVQLAERTKSVLIERITRTLLKVARLGTNTSAFFRNKKAQEKMIDYLFTEQGSKKILELASKNRQSKAFIRALSLARTIRSDPQTAQDIATNPAAVASTVANQATDLGKQTISSIQGQ